jgi:hypothetical protein
MHILQVREGMTIGAGALYFLSIVLQLTAKLFRSHTEVATFGAPYRIAIPTAFARWNARSIQVDVPPIAGGCGVRAAR